MQNLKTKGVAATQPCRCRQAANWQLSQTLKEVMAGFEGFVTKIVSL